MGEDRVLCEVGEPMFVYLVRLRKEMLVLL